MIFCAIEIVETLDFQVMDETLFPIIKSEFSEILLESERELEAESMIKICSLKVAKNSQFQRIKNKNFWIEFDAFLERILKEVLESKQDLKKCLRDISLLGRLFELGRNLVAFNPENQEIVWYLDNCIMFDHSLAVPPPPVFLYLASKYWPFF